ncbi:MAG: 50S ribosomal protein L3 [Proteobacteria bacterium]|nr:50S ribosomal protein L3 [Pseudomonadota bacterium]
MGLGLVGRKIGMTRIFTEVGDSVPVTVLDVSTNKVAGIKKHDKDGYNAVQVAFDKVSGKRITKSMRGHFNKAGIDLARLVKEFRVESGSLENLSIGDAISADIFAAGQFVDISGNSKGRGFSGVIRRHNFSSNRASHGNSLGHNKPGSTGNAQDPGRVFPGKKMAGQYGSSKRTNQNLQIVKVDKERELLLVRGSVAGAEGGVVYVRPSVKKAGVSEDGN